MKIMKQEVPMEFVVMTITHHHEKILLFQIIIQVHLLPRKQCHATITQLMEVNSMKKLLIVFEKSRN